MLKDVSFHIEEQGWHGKQELAPISLFNGKMRRFKPRGVVKTLPSNLLST